MIDYQRILTVIASSAVAKRVRVLLAVYEFADFTGAVPAMPMPPAEIFGEQIETMLTSCQSVISPETGIDGNKPE